MYKEPDGYLAITTNANGKKLSKGYVMIDGKKHYLEIYMNRKYNNVSVIYPKEKVHTYGLMYACEKVVTFGSTIGIEAVYWGKPSILAGRAFYEGLDCIYKVSKHEEVVKYIEAKLLNVKNRDSVLKYGFREATYGEKFRYYEPDNVNGGRFLGRKIEADFFWQNAIKVQKNIERIRKIPWYIGRSMRVKHRG